MTTTIREHRRKKGLKQSELAELVGVRRETIGNLERGRYNPSLRLAWTLSKALDTPLDTLFSFSDEETERDR